MGFRDPRVLSETLDNTSINRPSTPPSAESVPDPDRAAGTSTWTQGYIPSNATNAPAAPPAEEDDPYSNSTNTGLDYPAGKPNTNRYPSPANTKVGV